jgi:hypothetical protein
MPLVILVASGCMGGRFCQLLVSRCVPTAIANTVKECEVGRILISHEATAGVILANEEALLQGLQYSMEQLHEIGRLIPTWTRTEVLRSVLQRFPQLDRQLKTDYDGGAHPSFCDLLASALCVTCHNFDQVFVMQSLVLPWTLIQTYTGGLDQCAFYQLVGSQVGRRVQVSWGPVRQVSMFAKLT